MKKINPRDLPLLSIPHGMLQGTGLYTRTEQNQIHSIRGIHLKHRIRITIIRTNKFVNRWEVTQTGFDQYGICTIFSAAGNNRTPHGALNTALATLEEARRKKQVVPYSNTGTSGHHGHPQQSSAI